MSDEERWRRRIERERAARKEAERLLEDKSLELYRVNQSLKQLADGLEREIARRTEQLSAAVERAEAATRAKSDFLATMSHEIRTPMNGIIGNAQLLALSALDSRQHRWVETIRASGDTLLALINDILDISKIEACQLELEARPFALDLELDAVLLLFCGEAERRGLSLELRCRTLPPVVVGDSVRVRQIVSNLVSNALKFTHGGGIVIEAEADVFDGIARLRIAVADTGIGIPADKLERLFRPFSQVDVSTTRNYGGTGLGLAICRRLVEAMSGQIGVESAVGRGSTFRVEVALPIGETAAKPAAIAAAGPAGRAPIAVLVAEDNEVNMMIAVEFLQELGIAADTAADGREAVNRVRDRAYDLVLMDVQMPRMDGLAATRAIRSLDLARQPRIIALTANAFDSDREACLAAGMQGFLSKPFEIESLKEIVAVARAAPLPQADQDVAAAGQRRSHSQNIEVSPRAAPS